MKSVCCSWPCRKGPTGYREGSQCVGATARLDDVSGDVSSGKQSESGAVDGDPVVQGVAWRAELNLIGVVSGDDQVDPATAHIHELRDLCRIGVGATTRVMVGDFRACVGKAPQSDMDILGIKQGLDLAFVAEMVEATRSSCKFAADSGLESALA